MKLAALTVLAVPFTACQTTKVNIQSPDGQEPTQQEHNEDPGAPTYDDTADVGESFSYSVSEDIQNDATIDARLAELRPQVEARFNRVIGTLKHPMEKPDRKKPQTLLGNFAVDTMQYAADHISQTPVDFCFTNNGGLRRGITAGEVTVGTLTELMPFDNALVIFSSPGDEILQNLNRALKRNEPFSKLKVIEHPDEQFDIMLNGKPLDPNQSYRVCTTDYLFDGGGGFAFPKATDVSNTGTFIRDIYIEYVENLGQKGMALEVKLDDRFTFAK